MSDYASRVGELFMLILHFEVTIRPTLLLLRGLLSTIMVISEEQGH